MMNSKAKASRQVRGRPGRRAKALIVGMVVLGLAGIVLLATLHEQRTLPTPDADANDVLTSVPPPLTAAEEAYAAALWPIHSDVKVSAVQMTFAGLSYKLGELDHGGLHARLDELGERFASATGQLQIGRAHV